MSGYQLAQLNIARMRAPLESPQMADFTGNVDRINRLAEESPGYVWRLGDDSGGATALRPFGDDILVNMSVWQDVDALRTYMFKTDHVAIMRRRQEWFERMDEAHVVFWWVPEGHRPSLLEAWARLEHLRAHGPTAEAFNLRTAFPPPDAHAGPLPAAPPVPA